MTKFSAVQQNQLAQIGAFLRENREKQAKSLEDIAIRTYIRPQLLNGIETGDPEVLPEPIFVQGFIRRYAENLGINGVALSQQFTVTSIPATPRPAPPAPPTDSPTTRFTRPATGLRPETGATAAQIPMFSAGSEAALEASVEGLAASAPAPSRPVVERSPIEAAIEPPMANPPTVEPFTVQPLATESFTPDPFVTEPFTVDEDIVDSSPFVSSASVGDSSIEADGIPADHAPVIEPPIIEQPIIEPPIIEPPIIEPPIIEPPIVEPPIIEQQATPSMDEAFAQKLAAFEQANGSAFNGQVSGQVSAQAGLGNAGFEDELPASLTTLSADSSAEPNPVPAVSRSTAPVGIEYGEFGGTSPPNLKPFIIGGIAAVLTVGAIVLASLFGGGDRSPSVADNSVTAEQQTAPVTTAETLPAAPVTAPPASTAPVYVEATAAAEVWVSVIADGTKIYEGTLKPNEKKLWEAQSNLDVYSGDMGALQLAANGGAAATIGESGQPGGKVFKP